MNLTDPMKMFISLNLFIGLPTFTMTLASSYLILRRRPKTSVIAGVAGILLAALGFATPFFYGIEPQASSMLTTAVGIVFMALGIGLGLTIPQMVEQRRPLLGSIEVATVATLSAVYATIIVLTGQAFPSPTGGYLHLGNFVVFVAALTFGWKVGASLE